MGPALFTANAIGDDNKCVMLRCINAGGVESSSPLVRLSRARIVLYTKNWKIPPYTKIGIVSRLTVGDALSSYMEALMNVMMGALAP